MQLDQFQFDLPKNLIASYPTKERSQSRLMVVPEDGGEIKHAVFADLIQNLVPGDLLVFNDTKVIAARLKGNKQTGGKVEMLVERLQDENFLLAQLHVSKSPKKGEILYFNQGVRFQVVDKTDRFYRLQYLPETFEDVLVAIEAVGEIPLPPYMEREVNDEDRLRYQTVYARHKGSVAAPTAGLHFDDALLFQLKQKGILFGTLTLHIGAGTFLPVRTANITDHKMHAETIHISSTLCELVQKTKAAGKRVIAVGTTSARALETAARQGRLEPYQGDTDIFIYPGFKFNCVDALITNFHLPGSSLLMLVSALAGFKTVMNAYQIAISEKYRFYSYGDAAFFSKADFTI